MKVQRRLWSWQKGKISSKTDFLLSVNQDWQQTKKRYHKFQTQELRYTRPEIPGKNQQDKHVFARVQLWSKTNRFHKTKIFTFATEDDKWQLCHKQPRHHQLLSHLQSLSLAKLVTGSQIIRNSIATGEHKSEEPREWISWNDLRNKHHTWPSFRA